MRLTKSLNYFLIILNLSWALSAFIYDWPKIVSTPWYILPVMLICPIYPLLLAVWFIILARGEKPFPLLTSFAFIGAASYGLLALIFYPLMMIQSGWSWWTFGGIFWVLTYGFQSFILWPYVQYSPLAFLAPALYFLLKDILDYKYLTFGYLITEPLPKDLTTTFFALILAIHLTLFLLVAKKFDRIKKNHSRVV